MKCSCLEVGGLYYQHCFKGREALSCAACLVSSLQLCYREGKRKEKKLALARDKETRLVDIGKDWDKAGGVLEVDLVWEVDWRYSLEKNLRMKTDGMGIYSWTLMQGWEVGLVKRDRSSIWAETEGSVTLHFLFQKWSPKLWCVTIPLLSANIWESRPPPPHTHSPFFH